MKQCKDQKPEINFELICAPFLEFELDQKHMYELLNILVDNTLKHGYDTTEENIKVTIDVQAEEDGMTLCYQDNGKGFSEGIINRAFDSFSRGLTSSPGVGLGLTILYNRVTLLFKGRVKILSKSEESAKISLFSLEFDSIKHAL